jgi:membrane protease YdiL (CAAX protease family)
MWKKINRLARSHPIIATFLISSLFILVLLGFSVLLILAYGMTDAMIDAVTDSSFLALFTLGQIALSSIVIYLMKKMQVFEFSDFKFRNIGKGLLIGWFNIAFAVGAFSLTLFSLPENSLIMPNPFALIVTVLHPFLGTGIFEEVLVRGLILKILLLTMGHTKEGIIKACLISSAIFGGVHIGNIIVVGEFLPVIAQVIYATFIGVFYAALFLRTKTLWVPILLHGLTNVSNQIFNVILSPDVLQDLMQSQTDPSMIDAFMPVVFTIPFLIVGLILLRKVKTEDIEHIMPEHTE